ncbi:hypothetical protein NL526_29495, partial [Klebsiella pneumoniae]|nr:hypothetical protein [Klebsiella pneumoniae]
VTVLAIVAGLGWFVVKKTSFGETVKSYWTAIQKEENSRESTRDKIRRARSELGKMDDEIDRMVRPMAEYMAAVGKLKKDIAA